MVPVVCQEHSLVGAEFLAVQESNDSALSQVWKLALFTGDRRMFQSKRSQTSQIMQPPKMPRIVRDQSNHIGRHVPLSQSGGRCYDITHVTAAVAEHSFRFFEKF